MRPDRIKPIDVSAPKRGPRVREFVGNDALARRTPPNLSHVDPPEWDRSLRYSSVSILERRESSCWQAELCHRQSYFLSPAKKSNTHCLCWQWYCLFLFVTLNTYVVYSFISCYFLVLGQESEPVFLKAGLTLTIKILSASSSHWMFCLLLSVKKQGTTP